jgi:CBS domain-containing protein
MLIMKIGVKVGDVMTRNFTSAKPDMPLLSAVKLMVKKRVGSLLLVEKDVLKGMLTEKDIMWALSKKRNLSGVKSYDVCTRKIISIKPSADIYDAVKLMKKKKVRRLPVTVKKRVIGYLSMKDILRIQPELFEIAQKGYTIREYKDKLKRKKDAEEFHEGMCEECGNYDMLYESERKLVCESCRDEIE